MQTSATENRPGTREENSAGTLAASSSDLKAQSAEGAAQVEESRHRPDTRREKKNQHLEAWYFGKRVI